MKAISAPTDLVAIVVCPAQELERLMAAALLGSGASAAMARAAGVPEPSLVAQAVAEVGNNCLEHRDGPGPAVLRLGCRGGKLILRAINGSGGPATESVLVWERSR